jgi:hypothetical protein
MRSSYNSAGYYLFPTEQKPFRCFHLQQTPCPSGLAGEGKKLTLPSSVFTDCSFNSDTLPDRKTKKSGVKAR